MATEYNLKGKALVAMPTITDPMFTHSVCYICQHDAEGALGFIINKPIELREKDLLLDQHFEIANEQFQQPVLNGGPVHADRGFVMHRHGNKWQNTMPINKELYITTSLEILRAIAEQQIHDDYIILLGYASWEPGQLEAELLANDWLVAEVDTDLLFRIPFDQRWLITMKKLGIHNPANLILSGGHA